MLVDSRGVVPNEDGSALTTSNSAHNTHGSLQEINGQWYVFYHRPPRGFGNARQPMVAPVKIEWDKKKVADGGQVRITAYDPYAADEKWVAAAADGNVYTGAEVTSEGFQVYGLPPYAYYSAGYACYLSDQNWMQDNFDVWNNNMDVAGITNGGVVGFKYFGFGGLAQGQKGLKAFGGTLKGDGTQLDLYLTPGGHGAFKIHVMLDGPYANSTWNGREIAIMEVPDSPRGQMLHLQVPVPAVEGLEGKHAIFLVAEGADIPPRPVNPRFANMRPPVQLRPEGLFDLNGIGFSKPGTPCVKPEVPQLEFYADGKKLVTPTTPIRFTNLNGLSDQIRYQVYGPLKDGSKLEVKSSVPGVKIEVSPIVEGRATVKCTYNGLQKIFLVN